MAALTSAGLSEALASAVLRAELLWKERGEASLSDFFRVDWSAYGKAEKEARRLARQSMTLTERLDELAELLEGIEDMVDGMEGRFSDIESQISDLDR